jgi:hypothetical protein
MPIEHPKPTLSTIKELYGCALKCGFLDCKEPLFVDHANESGRSLNSKIAHICARREGGPRWDPNMSAEENRSAANLILMCAKHADEIDLIQRAKLYPVPLLREWKAAQVTLYDSASSGFHLTDDEAAEVLVRSEVTISLVAETINMGGAGGINGGSGGGGAAIGPGALGGHGGPVGQINLDGAPGIGPGSGGAGGGVIAPGAIPPGLHYQATQGVGYSSGTDGNDGGDSTFGSGDRVLLRAKGGKGGLAGTGIRGSSDRLRVTALLLVNYGEQREGLVSLLGGGWSNLAILNVPTCVGFPHVILFEAGGIPAVELTATIEVVDPAGKVCGTQSFPVTIQKAGDVLRIPRLGSVAADVHSFGLWSVVVRSNGRELARADLLIKRVGEA